MLSVTGDSTTGTADDAAAGGQSHLRALAGDAADGDDEMGGAVRFCKTEGCAEECGHFELAAVVAQAVQRAVIARQAADGGAKIVSLRLYDSPTASAPLWSKLASTMSSPIHSMTASS